MTPPFSSRIRLSSLIKNIGRYFQRFTLQASNL
jgi:hypothetical protein